jgi:hypothetical protein
MTSVGLYVRCPKREEADRSEFPAGSRIMPAIDTYPMAAQLNLETNFI